MFYRFLRGFYLHYGYYRLLPRYIPEPAPRCDITRLRVGTLLERRDCPRRTPDKSWKLLD